MDHLRFFENISSLFTPLARALAASKARLSPSFPPRLQRQRAGFCKIIQMMKTSAAITQI